MLIKCTKLQAVSLPHASADVRLLSGRRYYKGIYTSIRLTSKILIEQIK